MKNIIVFLFFIFISLDLGAEEGHEGHGGNPNVGPGKGIAVADEHEGIKLSSEAVKNFELKTLKLTGVGPWVISPSAKVSTGEETNIFRFRKGFYRRIDFSILDENAKEMKITSKELKEGDEVVVAGVPFLRTAEISAFEGVPDEH